MLAKAALLAVFLVANVRADWPQPALPDRISVFPVGNQLTANGVPMRVQGFMATEDTVDDLVTWFRGHWGPALMENTLGRKRILGRVQNGFYWTVQLEPSGRGARGLVAVTDLSARTQAGDRYAAASERLLARFPVGSRLVSYVVSPLEGRSASHVVVSNGHSEGLNHDALKAMLADEGMVLERETSAQSRHSSAIALLPGNASKTLFFKGQGKEAIAVIGTDAQDRTTVILNTVTTMERFKK